MADEAKQGDSDAHDACCRFSDSFAAIERGSLARALSGSAGMRLLEIHGPARLQNLGLF